MTRLLAFFRLIRINNLAIMAATQTLAYYCLTDLHSISELLNTRFMMLVSSTILSAAAGYIINDYHDVKLDMINKPGSVIVGTLISRRSAMAFHSAMNIIAILFALMINLYVGIAVSLCVTMLWFYSTYFKRGFLMGNLMVSILSGFVILIIRYFDPQASTLLVASYGLFAFMMSLIREIVKDAEDIQGDLKFDCRTLPIVLGIRKTKKILLLITLTFILALLFFLFKSIPGDPELQHINITIYQAYMILFVVAPLLVITRRIYTSDVKKDFSYLSGLCKLVMVSGMLSMILLKL